MSEKAKHTPGPWRVDKRFDTDSMEIVVTAGGSHIRPIVARVNASPKIVGRLPGCGTATPSANAHLIAAAPDLLAACEAVQQALIDLECDTDGKAHIPPAVSAQLDAAVAAAKGAK